MGARLVALPGQAALEQEQQRVRQALQVVAPAGGAAQVRVHARIPHRAPAQPNTVLVPCSRHRTTRHGPHTNSTRGIGVLPPMHAFYYVRLGTGAH